MVFRPEYLCTFLLTIAILSHVSQPLHFELKSGKSKCISEDIKSNAMTVGKYTVVNPNEPHPAPQSHKINIRVLIKFVSSFFRKFINFWCNTHYRWRRVRGTRTITRRRWTRGSSRSRRWKVENTRRVSLLTIISLTWRWVSIWNGEVVFITRVWVVWRRRAKSKWVFFLNIVLVIIITHQILDVLFVVLLCL